MSNAALQISTGFLISTLFLGSCASTSVIRSEPSGAKVYINEESAGNTPYSYTDSKIVGSRTEIRLEKDGYEPFSTTLIRNEEANVGAIIGTIFFLVPALWIMEYKPIHTYDLTPLNGETSDSNSPVNEEGALTISQIQRLRELKKLQVDGILSAKEFEEQKAKILGEKN